MVRTTAIWMLVLGACGRAGFGTQAPADAAMDGAMPDIPPDDTDAAQRLPCGVVPRFTVGGTSDNSELSATATERGYDVFVVEAGAARGFSFTYADGALTPGVRDIAIAREPGVAADLSDGYRFGPLAIGDDVLVAGPYGHPEPTGTALISLDAELGTRASFGYDGWFASHGALARSAGGSLAFLVQSLGTEQVDAMLVSATGTKILGPYPVLVGGSSVNDPTILPASTGFVVAWSAPTTAPRQLLAERLDEQLAITSQAPVPISPDTQFVIGPRAAYLPGADRYLFTWYQKTDQPAGDEVWISLRDGNLAAVLPPIMISGSSKSTSPMVVAGLDDFLVVWRVGDAGLAAARVSTKGDVSSPVIRTSGQVAAYDAVVRHGQPAVVWLENGGSGPNLWFDPLCSD